MATLEYYSDSSVASRPLPRTGVDKFSQFMYAHKTLGSKLDEYLPENVLSVILIIDRVDVTPTTKSDQENQRGNFTKIGNIK